MKQEKKKKFKIATLGCRTNQYETQAYADQLLGMGYQEVQEGETADLCIVNTCTVTESADSHSRREIRHLAKSHPGSKLVVTGCYAENRPSEVAQISGVTHVISNKNKETLLREVFPEEEIPEFAIKHFEAHTRAFVKVQDGCNSFCSYCIIPYVRGRSRSRSIPDVLQEVQDLVKNGFKEVVLTGINIGDFDGNVENMGLADLVRAVDEVPGLERLRVSSIDPDEVDEALMEAILKGKKTCHSMHVVLQSGSNVILKKMNRKYTRQVFLDTVERLKKEDPDFTITTDVIVGFPGETDTDFKDTLDVIREVKFAKVHMFPYSERPRTRAALFPNKISPAVIKIRKQEVLTLAEQVAYELRNQFLGKSGIVLTENLDPNRPGEIFGHTAHFVPVWIQEGNLLPNMLVSVDFFENTPTGLLARVNPCTSTSPKN